MLAHEFVEFVPHDLEDGKLYVSTEFATAAHLCACGCGTKIVTPISPAQWQLTFDGESVSLMPSIGNWQLPCRSHYWIRNNRVRWGRQWTEDEIAAGRARDQWDAERHYTPHESISQPIESTRVRPRRRGLLVRLWRRIKP